MNGSVKFSLSRAERAVFALRALYESRGYERFKVNKFEEYDFYAGCKSFLTSENVLTFTDSGGRLMALKPDVTLSVVKNADPDAGGVRKVYYNESVYRDYGDGNGFREITQTGLECVGAVDEATVAEAVRLAEESLAAVSEGRETVLTVSHMGVVSGVLGGVDPSVRDEIRGYMENKNADGVRRAAAGAGVGGAVAEKLVSLLSVYGSFDDAEGALLRLCGDIPECAAAVAELGAVCRSAGDRIRIDFSVAGDMNYYTGIVFRGYVNGIPKSVLSGGRYDGLLRGMGRARGGVGFAVMTDLLEAYPGAGNAGYGTFLTDGGDGK